MWRSPRLAATQDKLRMEDPFLIPPATCPLQRSVSFLHLPAVGVWRLVSDFTRGAPEELVSQQITLIAYCLVGLKNTRLVLWHVEVHVVISRSPRHPVTAAAGVV